MPFIAYVRFALLLLAAIAAFVFIGSLGERVLACFGAEAVQVARRRRAVRRMKIAVALALVPFCACAYWYEPYIGPTRYLGRLERNSAPLIAAIDQFVADHGRPPIDLPQLVPKYIAVLPASGYRPHPEFHYFTNDPHGEHYWQIYVFCEALDFLECDEMCFDSRDRAWHYPH